MSFKPHTLCQLSCYALSTAAFSIADPQTVNALTVNEVAQRNQEGSSAFSQTLLRQENAAIAATALPEAIPIAPEITSTSVSLEKPAPESLESDRPALEFQPSDRPQDQPDLQATSESPVTRDRPSPSEAVQPKAVQPKAIQVAEMPQLEVRVDRPRIEVGTTGMPSMTDLPARVGLPQDPLLPSSFENPIVLGQAMDPAIQTATPISDTMPDPVWSRQVADLPSYQAAYSRNLKAWASQVQACMLQHPKLYVMRSDGVKLPMYFDGKEGTVIQNASGAAICPVSI